MSTHRAVSKSRRATELIEHKAWREKNREAVVKLQLENQALRKAASELEEELQQTKARFDAELTRVQRAHGAERAKAEDAYNEARAKAEDAYNEARANTEREYSTALIAAETALADARAHISELENKVATMAAHPDVIAAKRQAAIAKAEAQKREAEKVLAELQGE